MEALAVEVPQTQFFDVGFVPQFQFIVRCEQRQVPTGSSGSWTRLLAGPWLWLSAVAVEVTGHYFHESLVSGCFFNACLDSGYLFVSLLGQWKYFTRFLREGELGS